MNNLLKSLLSKSETKFIQRKYETIRWLTFYLLTVTFFESHDPYVVTYKPVYVSTKISVELNPYSKLWFGIDLNILG